MSGTRPTTKNSSGWRRRAPLLSLAVAAALLPFAGLGADAAGDAEDADHGADAGATSSADDELLQEGAAVYSSVCSSCHQPGGVGVSGDFPPLVNNPNLDDPAYIEEVILNGRTGELTVDGVTYNGVMPAQSTLSDADVEAVVFYIQSGFAAPSTPAVEVDTGPVAGTELPLLADYAWITALLIAAGGVALVLGPRLIAANDRREITWLDAWMKTAVIVVGLIVVTTIIPAQVLENETVQDLPQAGQDIIVMGIWSTAIVVSLGVLWYAHREKRI